MAASRRGAGDGECSRCNREAKEKVAVVDRRFKNPHAIARKRMCLQEETQSGQLK